MLRMKNKIMKIPIHKHACFGKFRKKETEEKKNKEIKISHI
jgi:hypothetical protein